MSNNDDIPQEEEIEVEAQFDHDEVSDESQKKQDMEKNLKAAGVRIIEDEEE